MTYFNLQYASVSTFSKTTRWLILGLMLLMLTQLTGCGSSRTVYGSGKDGPPPFHVDASKVPDAVPKHEKPNRYANPHSYVVRGKRYYVMKNADNYRETGGVSWYGTKFHTRRTSSGERYDLLGMTAAHKTLPIPSYVRVTNLKNGREVVVKVNDRGPFHPDRIIDLSYVAAKKLGISGTGQVEVAVVKPGYTPTQLVSASQTQTSTPVEYADANGIRTSSPSGNTGKPKLYLQMGVFAERANAEKIAQTIENNLKMQVQIKPDRHNNQLVYRVRVPVANEGNVSDLSEQLVQQGLGRPVRVVD